MRFIWAGFFISIWLILWCLAYREQYRLHRQNYTNSRNNRLVEACKDSVTQKQHIERGQFAWYVTSKDLCRSTHLREQFALSYYHQEYWKSLYQNLLLHDHHVQSNIAGYIRKIAQKQKWSRMECAKAIVEMIQSEPYILIHPNSCEQDKLRNPFSAAYHGQGGRCLAHTKFGLLSPYEFSAYLAGDCDTRTLWAYSILNELGYEVAIISNHQHTVLGVNLFCPIGTSLWHQGRRYSLWELSSTGFQLGDISPEFRHTRWEVVLQN